MNHSRTSKKSHHRGARRILLASLAVAALACGTTAYANDTPASGTETDTLVNQIVSNYDHPDRNLVINWEISNTLPGDGSAIRNGTVNARNITIDANFNGNQWTDKGIISEGTTHVTAGENINVKAHDDAVYTQSNGSIVIDGFKNLIIKATGNNWFSIGGYGVVDNGDGIKIQGAEGSTVNISTVAGYQSAIGNSVENPKLGKGVTINANEITLDAPRLAIFAGPGKSRDFAVNLNASTVNIKGAIDAAGGNVSINSDTNGSVTIEKGTWKGSFLAPAVPYSILATGDTGHVTVNKNQGGLVQITGDVRADTGASVTINGTKEKSFIEGNVLASQGGTLNLKLTGDNSSLNGNLTTKASSDSSTNAAITAEFSGNNTKFTGDADNVASMGLTFNNGSNWTGNLKNTSGTSTVGLTNGSSWTGSLTNTSGDSTVSLSNGSLWTGDLTNTSGTTTVNLDGSIWDGAAVSVKFSSVIHLTVDNYYLRGFGLISISV